MKRILYDTGPRVIARWSRERVSKLRISVLVKRPPPKNRKNKFCIKMLFRPFRVFLAYVFLIGKLTDPDP